MDHSILKKLDLSDKEIKVYLKLLEYGSTSVRNIAELAGLNRGTTYDILKKLQETGLATYYDQDTKQKFVAEDPEKIYQIVNRREEELKTVKAKISELIPELKSLQDKDGDKPTTKFYEGKAGVRSILEDVLENLAEGDEYYVYSAKKASEDWKAAFPDFTEKKIRRNIKVKAISLDEGGKTAGSDERRWLGTKDESATFIMIYAGKCAFLSRDAKGEPVGVIIENRMIYETQRIIFSSLWSFLGK